MDSQFFCFHNTNGLENGCEFMFGCEARKVAEAEKLRIYVTLIISDLIFRKFKQHPYSQPGDNQCQLMA